MPSSSKFLLRGFKDRDTLHSVSRKTLKAIAERLGVNETQAVQIALARLRAEVLPAYESDDGPVPQAMIDRLRKVEPQDDYQPTKSLIPGRLR